MVVSAAVAALVVKVVPAAAAELQVRITGVLVPVAAVDKAVPEVTAVAEAAAQEELPAACTLGTSQEPWTIITSIHLSAHPSVVMVAKVGNPLVMTEATEPLAMLPIIFMNKNT